MPRFIRRERAATYLLIVVVSFALSVVGIRLMLYLTGYPQLGNSTIHVAHVIWGGLLLGLGALAMLLFSNSRILYLSAILTGSGFGLFIDEVGKYLTQSNDYFFRPAAPIIYLFFLSALLLYIYFQRTHAVDDRELFHHVLDDCKEILDEDLDPVEKTNILNKLQTIAATETHEDLRQFARVLLHYVEDLESQAPRRKNRLRLWAESEYLKWLHHPGLQRLLSGIFFALLFYRGMSSIIDLAISTAYLFGDANMHEFLVTQVVDPDILRHRLDLPLYLAQIIADGIVGSMVIIAIYQKVVLKQWNSKLFSLAIIFSLLTGDIIGFYFNQFQQVVNITIDVGSIAILDFLQRSRLASEQEIRTPMKRFLKF